MLAQVKERVDGPLRGSGRDRRPTGQISMQFIDEVIENRFFVSGDLLVEKCLTVT